MTDADKTFKPWAGPQQRGLLRARLLAGRGSAQEADEICRRLIADLENEQPHKEWDRALVAPLASWRRAAAPKQGKCARLRTI